MSSDSVPCLNLTEHNHTSGVSPPSSNSTSNMPCPNVPCMTLTEYANQLTRMHQAPGSNITLVFLPGAHHLGSDLLIRNVSNLFLSVAPTNTSSPVVAMVTCVPSSGFIFEDIAGVSVSGLEFSGCEGNTVRSVDQLTIEDCTFRDGGHLYLTSIGNGSVLRSSFNSLRGEGRGGALYVGDSSIIIHSSSFTNNTALGIRSYDRWWEDGGGAIFAEQSELTIYNSNFTINTAAETGGAIYSEGGHDVTIHSSNFSNNTAGSAGGAIFSLHIGDVTTNINNTVTVELLPGVGVILSMGDVGINSSSFSNNIADWGGALCSSDDVTVNSSSFSNNTAGWTGGAIHSLGIFGTINSNNTADLWGGGAIFSWFGDVTINSSSFTNNTAGHGGAIFSYDRGDVTVHSSSFNNNTGSSAGHSPHVSGTGGAIFSSFGGDVTINSSSFTRNTGGDGGALSLWYINNIAITSTEFIGNKAVGVSYRQGDGGAISLYYRPGDGGAISLIAGNIGNDGTVSNCTFINNSAKGSGGALSIQDTSRVTVTLRNNTLKNNTAVRGGAVYAQLSTLIMNINDIAYNSAEQGGALYAQYGSEVRISMNSFTNNTARDGGAIYSLENIYSTIAIETSTFSYNRAFNDGGGGAIYSWRANFNIHNSNFTNNTAHDGGAIFSRQNSMIVIHVSTFSYQMVPNAGGGIYSQEDSNITIHTSNFSHNVALNDGGGAIYSLRTDINIHNSNFTNNTARDGGAIHSRQSSIVIRFSTFSYQTASNAGGAIYSREDSNITIHTSNFNSNTATYGGAIYSREDSITTIHNSNFTNNTVRHGGTIFSRENSIVTIFRSTFTHNTCTAGHTAGRGGAIHSREYSTIVIHTSQFTYNMAGRGGAIYSREESVATVYMSNFTNNAAIHHGGAIYSWDESALTTTTSIFAYNTAGNGGAVRTFYSNITTQSSTFIGNIAANKQAVKTEREELAIDDSSRLGDGGAMSIANSIGNVFNCAFIQNTAELSGGALNVESSRNVAIRDNTFSSNTADKQGGAIHVQSSSLISSGFLDITNNTAMLGVVVGCDSKLTLSGNTTISDNYGSVYAYASNVTFHGYTSITNNSPISNNQEGGAVTSFQGEIVLMDTVELTYNQVTNGSGGAISATESKIYSYGDTIIAHNTALAGGGIYAYQSELSFNGGTTNIRNNTADMRGGGIYAVSSTTKLSGGVLQIIENTAERGGGMCLEMNAKLYVVKHKAECLKLHCKNNVSARWLKLEFANNSADYGGALYVSDDTNSGTCSAKPEQPTSSECFFQALALHSTQSVELNLRNAYFDGNSATVSGGTIFGGLLDRCKVSPQAEIFRKNQSLSPSTLQATSYLASSNVTNLQTKDVQTEISSEPVRICFCRRNQPDCNLQERQQFKVQRGEAFSVSLVAVDQVNNPVPSTVKSTLLSPDGKLGDGQDKQNTTSNCTGLTYNVTSPYDSNVIFLYADGPCKDNGISQTHFTVNFLPCTCPIGFEKKPNVDCDCDCDPELSEYVTSCSIATESVERKDNIWIAHINTTEQEGYLSYTHCPFDYCKLSTDQVWINLNVPNGSDAQCAFNRSGKLCGSCEDGLSLSLGSSCCMPYACSNNRIALLIVFAIAGVALVAFLLLFNLTVAVGTINGLIFYANILVTNRATFFPFEKPNFFTVFIAWINLDFGFVTCFFDGMDGYSKTWLQFAFPLYIIFLVAMVIIACEYTTRLARLFTKTDPVATLATLILLSYTKSLRLIIAALSSATLEYPDGSNERLWLTDPNIRYFEGKHVPLFVVALLILVLGIGYTLLLFFWQWLLLCPNRRALSWIRHARFYPFMDAYHAPYTLRHRYWTGLLLFIRVILYLTAALNVSGDPSINLLSISCVQVGLLVLDKLLPGKVYKTWTLNALENSFTFNLIIFSVGTYHVRESGGNQAALAYTSTSIALVTFLAILVYHTFTFVLPKNPTLKDKLNSIKLKLKRTDNEEDDTPEIKQAPENKCTYSVVDGPKRHDILGKGDEKNEIEPSSTSHVTTHNHSSPSNELHSKNHTAIELQEIPAAHNRADSNDPPQTVDSEFEAVAIEHGNEPPTQSRSPLDPYIDDIDIEQKGIERETEIHDFIQVTQ